MGEDVWADANALRRLKGMEVECVIEDRIFLGTVRLVYSGWFELDTGSHLLVITAPIRVFPIAKEQTA